MASHCGHVIPRGPQCKRWDFARLVLSKVCHSRRCSTPGSVPEQGGPDVQIRPKKCISNGTCASRGPSPSRHGLERSGVCGHSPAIWSPLRPKNILAVADGITWAMHRNGLQSLIHYLDDFLLVGPPGNPTSCQSNLAIALETCSSLGFPTAPEKTEGPSTTIVFLGIEIDSILMELRLPKEKLSRLKALTDHWLVKKAATKRELQSIIGHLSHAASVVRAGRPFIRHLIETSKIPRSPHCWVRLNSECRADIAWWHMFIQGWNGSSFMPSPTHTFTSTSDASGSWGCGALCSTLEWFQLGWPPLEVGKHDITVKEMIPVVISAAIWGHHWKGERVLFVSDNYSVVSVINTRSAKHQQLVHLSCCLFFFAAYHGFSFSTEHIAGQKNGAADALSRNNLPLYFQLVPQAQSQPSVIQAALFNLLWEQPVEWTSPRWRQMFKDSMGLASQVQPLDLMPLQRDASSHSALPTVSPWSQ